MHSDYFAAEDLRVVPYPASLSELSAHVWELPKAMFVVDSKGLMSFINLQGEELAEDCHLHSVHLDPEWLIRGSF